jgi:methylated-DNA-protein-cysteine methyltransferase related protein
MMLGYDLGGRAGTRAPGRFSAEVPLYRLGIPDGRLVRVESGVATRSALVEQIPALVQADPEPLEPVSLVFAELPVRLFLEELVFLVGQLVDPSDDILVFHSSSRLSPSDGPIHGSWGRHPSSTANLRRRPILPSPQRIIPVRPVGREPPVTEFEREVRAVIGALLPGEVVTYGEVAEEAGHPGASRAVGNILAGSEGLPWWRVVSASGRLVPGHEAEQARRLRAEGVAVSGAHVSRRTRRG